MMSGGGEDARMHGDFQFAHYAELARRLLAIARTSARG